jgi:hypothetical protein
MTTLSGFLAEDNSAERCRKALERLAYQWRFLERITDPLLLEDADAALAEVLYHEPRPSVVKSPRDSGTISIETALALASGSWRELP